MLKKDIGVFFYEDSKVKSRLFIVREIKDGAAWVGDLMT